MRGLITIVFIFLASLNGHAQELSEIQEKQKKDRTKLILAGTGGAYVGTMAVLASSWYNLDRRSDFFFFNDNSDWRQVDKMGHFYSAFQISRISAGMYRWAHHEQKKAALYGALTGIVLMTPIEILDGFSENYGASTGDIYANLLGVGFFLGQEMLWKEDRIKVKFSYSPTSYPEYRPELLGSNPMESLLKDYNGHTYWLSFDSYLLTGKKHNWMKWINPAFGAGADGMVYSDETANNRRGYESYRQWYFSIDPNLSHLKTRSKLLNTLIFLIDGIKIPSPALEFSRGEVHFHPLFF